MLIVDDHPIVRQGLRQLLEVQPGIAVAGEAESGEQAVQVVGDPPAERRPHGHGDAGADGVDAISQIRELSPHTQVVVLTSHHGDALVFPAIKAGALGYLLKSALPEEVVDAVRAAARREPRLHPRVATWLMQEVSADRQRPTPDALTPRELEVLGLIAQGRDNAAIAEALTLTEKTVKTHVSNMLSKLQLADRTQADIYALRQHTVPLEERE